MRTYSASTLLLNYSFGPSLLINYMGTTGGVRLGSVHSALLARHYRYVCSS